MKLKIIFAQVLFIVYLNEILYYDNINMPSDSGALWNDLYASEMLWTMN